MNESQVRSAGGSHLDRVKYPMEHRGETLGAPRPRIGAPPIGVELWSGGFLDLL